MMIKQEALNVVFGGVVIVPPYSMADTSSTSSVTSTPSGRPPLEPRTPGPQTTSLGAHGRTGGALSWLGELWPMPSDSAGHAIEKIKKSKIKRPLSG
jgi:hypothetical protein